MLGGSAVDRLRAARKVQGSCPTWGGIKYRYWLNAVQHISPWPDSVSRLPGNHHFLRGIPASPRLQNEAPRGVTSLPGD